MTYRPNVLINVKPCSLTHSAALVDECALLGVILVFLLHLSFLLTGFDNVFTVAIRNDPRTFIE